MDYPRMKRRQRPQDHRSQSELLQTSAVGEMGKKEDDISCNHGPVVLLLFVGFLAEIQA